MLRFGAMICLLLMARPAISADPGRRDFTLPTSDNGKIELRAGSSDFATVLCFLGTECPLARLYGPRLSKLDGEFADSNVRFLGIDSNRQDSLEEIETYRTAHDISFPIAKDYDNVIADAYEVQRTPEVIVLNNRLEILYRGRVDDQYEPGLSRQQPTMHHLRDALRSIVSGEPVGISKTEPVGCLVGRVKAVNHASQVTFANQISRILNKNCVECHRHGEIGPFALTEYDEVAGWAEMMVEVVEQGRMPPWHADPKFGHFDNARFMSAVEKQTLKEWVNAGTPFGDAKDLPTPPSFVDGWQLPKEPDLIVKMREKPFTVPAEGTVEYQYFVVDPKFEEEKWILASQVKPGNASVVHHSIVFIRPPDGSRFRGVGWLGAYVPGNRNGSPLPGHAVRVPAGSKLVFQQHYTPSGKIEQDTTQIGIVFADKNDVTDEVFTIIGIDQEFEIPPFASDHVVAGQVGRLPKRGQLISIMPHMHVRGKSFRLTVQNGQQQSTLLHVPQYDFNWQHSYRLTAPIPFSQIDQLGFEVRFDNSANNPVNPDPKQYVTWGDQTWEEMAVAFFTVSEPLNVENAETNSTTDAPSTEVSQRAIDFAEQFFRKHDLDGNGTVIRDETPISFQRFGFRKFDSNSDNQLTREEITKAADSRFKNRSK